MDRPRVARPQDRPWSASSRYRRGFPAPQVLDASPASGAQSRTCRVTGACAEGTRASLRNPSTARAEAPGWVSGDPSLCWEQRLDPACGPGLAWPQRLPPSPAGAQRLLRLARGDTPHTRGGVGAQSPRRAVRTERVPPNVDIGSAPAADPPPASRVFSGGGKESRGGCTPILSASGGGRGASPGPCHTRAPRGGAASPAQPRLSLPGPAPQLSDRQGRALRSGPHACSAVTVLPFP